jgi:hypothetical protein
MYMNDQEQHVKNHLFYYNFVFILLGILILCNYQIIGLTAFHIATHFHSSNFIPTLLLFANHPASSQLHPLLPES